MLADCDGTFSSWSLVDGLVSITTPQQAEKISTGIFCLCYHPSSQTLWAGSLGLIVIFSVDPLTSETALLFQVLAHQRHRVNAMACTAKGTMWTVGDDGFLCGWLGVPSSPPLQLCAASDARPAKLTALALPETASMVCTGSVSGTLTLWSPSDPPGSSSDGPSSITLVKLYTLARAHCGQINGLCFRESAMWPTAVCSMDKRTLRVWEVFLATDPTSSASSSSWSVQPSSPAPSSSSQPSIITVDFEDGPQDEFVLL